MTTTYREIRLHNLKDAVGFSRGHGSTLTPEQVHHNLSLAAHVQGEVAGYALCHEEGGHHVVELALSEAAVRQGLSKPLADTALRKMQSAGVGTARVRSLNEGELDQLWQVSNWLDHIPNWGAAELDDDGAAAPGGCQAGGDAGAEPAEPAASA